MRSVLITGCRSGLGLEFVKQLLKHETANPEILIATCRKIEDAPELKDLSSKNSNLHILELELLEYDKYNKFSEEVRKLVGEKGLNVLFHNAGVIGLKEANIELATADDLIRQYKTNTVAPILLTKALLPLLKTAAKSNESKPLGVDKAAVVCMSSYLGSISSNSSGGYWGYRESKAAVNISMRSMQKEFEKDGIATLVLHPGWVRTKMGGPGGTLSTEESVSGLMPVVLGLSPKTSGGFYQYDGKALPW